MTSTALLTALGSPPSDPSTLGTDLEGFLQQFHDLMINGGGPYVHPRTISFHNEQDKVNWQHYMPDATARDTFENFAGPSPKHGKKTWIGLFSTPNGPLVGDQWETREWHVFVIAIISGSHKLHKGKRILIWDCDPVPHAAEVRRWRSVLFGKQRSFVEYLRNKRHMSKAEIWYNTDNSNSGRNECLVLSLRKVWEWVGLGDLSYQGLEDPRFQNCIRLRF